MKSNFPKLSLFLSLVLIACSCFAFIVLYKQIYNNNDTAEKVLTDWQTEENRRNDILALQNSIASIEADKALLETHFARSSDVVPFLNMLERLGPSVGVKAEILLVSISTDKKNLVVQLKATGSFDAIYKFIRLLENSPYEIKFDSLDLQKSNTQDGEDEIDAITEWSATIGIKLLSFFL